MEEQVEDEETGQSEWLLREGEKGKRGIFEPLELEFKGGVATTSG